MIKKYLPLTMVIIIIATLFSACSSNSAVQESPKLIQETTTEFVTDTSSFKLSYSQSDSLDPYKSETLNNQILQTLVFDSLFIVDDGYVAEPGIATSYAYTDDKTLVVTFPSGILFSDGSELTANDIVSSFNKAQSSPHWKNSLKSISGASVLSANQVQFNLSYANPNAQNLLTFAITNGNSDDKGYPIGSGRYKFGEGDGQVYIEVNKEHKDFNPHFTRILLVNITSEESIENAINIGNISYAFRDMSSGSKTRMQCNKKPVNLNNLVYIGVNCYSGITANEYIRQAISVAVDRDTIVKSSYQGYGRAAASIFNPSSAIGKQTQIFSNSADTAEARQLIAQSGYNQEDLKLDILTSNNPCKAAAAELIKQQLEDVGFKVTINQEKSSDYKKAVKNRSFNIYIGETKIPKDLNLNSFFTSKGGTRYGINLEESGSAKAYESYLGGEEEIGKFVLEFSKENPFIPLLYRQGMICYTKSLHGDMQGYADNFFSNIEDWYI